MVQKLDKVRTFFWQGGQAKRKYHLVRWAKICKSKKKGGLGIKDISKLNLSLLCKLWWKLEVESGLWQTIVPHKYLKKETVISVKHRQTDSPMWADLLKVKPIYLQGRNIPTSFEQSWRWCERWLPKANQFHAVGIAAICWAIWKMRNKICFEGQKIA
jgi:hypothetical protein